MTVEQRITESEPGKVFPPNITAAEGMPADTSIPSGSEVGDARATEIKKETSTEVFKTQMRAGQARVLVAVRIRPLSTRDIGRAIVRGVHGNVVVVLDPNEDNSDDILRQNRSREKQYAFDHVFEEHASQKDVYEGTTKFLIDGVLNGYNATVFCYGATGAGKTFTMLGTDRHPGLIHLTLQDLFQRIADSPDRKQFTVTLTYLEIYNENIIDLLSAHRDCLELREDPVKGVVVAGITQRVVTSVEHVLAQVQRGNRRRTTEPTFANVVSSRSHAVLTVVVERKNVVPTEHHSLSVKIGKLTMIDLAGSERAAVTKNRGMRFLEGANINRSLLALGNCINALGEKGSRGKYVNYRDSKLTRLLRDSLGGNTRTVMISNVSPASSQFEDTHNTLKYASRARNIKTKVSRNVLDVSYHITQYNAIIEELRAEISRLRSRISSHPSTADKKVVGVDREMPSGSLTHSSSSQLSSDSTSHPEPLSSTGGGNGDGIKSSDLGHTSGNKHGQGHLQNGDVDEEDDRMAGHTVQILLLLFQQHLEYRRRVMDVDEVSVRNTMEITQHKADITCWQRQLAAIKDLETPTSHDLDLVGHLTEHIAHAQSEMKDIVENHHKNSTLKREYMATIKSIEAKIARTEEEAVPKIVSVEKRRLVELLFKYHLSQLENMELESNSNATAAALQSKLTTLKAQEYEISLYEKICALQKQILADNNASSEALEELYATLRLYKLHPMPHVFALEDEVANMSPSKHPTETEDPHFAMDGDPSLSDPAELTSEAHTVLDDGKEASQTANSLPATATVTPNTTPSASAVDVVNIEKKGGFMSKLFGIRHAHARSHPHTHLHSHALPSHPHLHLRNVGAASTGGKDAKRSVVVVAPASHDQDVNSGVDAGQSVGRSRRSSLTSLGIRSILSAMPSAFDDEEEEVDNMGNSGNTNRGGDGNDGSQQETETKDDGTQQSTILENAVDNTEEPQVHDNLEEGVFKESAANDADETTEPKENTTSDKLDNEPIEVERQARETKNRPVGMGMVMASTGSPKIPLSTNSSPASTPLSLPPPRKSRFSYTAAMASRNAARIPSTKYTPYSILDGTRSKINHLENIYGASPSPSSSATQSLSASLSSSHGFATSSSSLSSLGKAHRK